MINYRLTKQAFRQLKKLQQSDINTARHIKSAIISLSEGNIEGEALQGYSDFKKIRVGKYRLIYTVLDKELLIAIIEKRETVYKTFKHLFKNSNFIDI